MQFDKRYHIGEVLSVEKTRPYTVNPRTGELAPKDKGTLTTSMALFVAVPGLDEGKSYPMFMISSRLFTQKEFAQWLLARNGNYESMAQIQARTRLKEEAARRLGL